MAHKNENNSTFNSWKEIARYLDVDVRTCQRWEKKFQLPVRRFDDCLKSRVFIYRKELDKWLEQKLVNNGTADQENKKEPALRNTLRLLPGGLLFLTVLLLFLVFRGDPSTRIPYDFRIQKSELVVLNKSAQELWRHDTGFEDLAGDEKYRFSSQVKKLNHNNMVSLPLIMIKDITGDRLPEILFARLTANKMNSNTLFIFNHTGRVITTINTGREIKFGDTTYSADFYIYGFNTVDLDEDGRGEIMLVSNQNPFFPTQLLILDCQGNQKGEYWNAGRISDIIAHDLNKDGSKEILISGINNEYKKGFLAVFDSRDVQGASPQNSAKYTGNKFKKGSQLFYILFPRTDLDLLEYLLDNIVEIKILENNQISARSRHTKNIFLFDPDLNLASILFSNDFEFRHKQAVREKKINSILNREYKNLLKKNLLYFNGQSWVNKAPRS